MGLAVGLAWIIIGVVYVAYKFLTEELHHSSFEACVRLCLLIVGIVVIGCFHKYCGSAGFVEFYKSYVGNNVHS